MRTSRFSTVEHSIFESGLKAEKRQEIIEIDRLDEVKVELNLPDHPLEHFGGIPRDRNDSGGLQSIVVAESFDDLESIEFGKSDVNEKDVGNSEQSFQQRGLTIMNDLRLIPSDLHQDRQRCREVHMIIGNQDEGRLILHSRDRLWLWKADSGLLAPMS